MFKKIIDSFKVYFLYKNTKTMTSHPVKVSLFNKIKYLFKIEKPNWFSKKEEKELEKINWFGDKPANKYPVSWGEYTYTIIKDDKKIIKSYPASRNYKEISFNTNTKINDFGLDRKDETRSDYVINNDKLKKENELAINLEKKQFVEEIM